MPWYDDGMYTALRFLGTAAAVILTISLVPGVSATGGWMSIFLLALVWSVLTLVVRPVLVLLTLPLTMLTLGLFYFVLNALLFYGMQWIVPGFFVASFWSAFLGAIVLSVLNWLIQKVIV